jgi:hypothetical protein
MAQTSEEALETLRDVWKGNGQTSADIDEACAAGANNKVCRNAAHMGFEGYADDESGDVRTGWQKTLEREGKRNAKAGTLADLIFGDGPRPEPSEEPQHQNH